MMALARAMVKETKFFRKQAAKAERVARSADAEISQRFLNKAMTYRSQAAVMKAKKIPHKATLTAGSNFLVHALVHVKGRIFAKHILRGNQDVVGQRLRRHLLAPQHLHGDRQDLIAIAVEIIGHRTQNDA